MGSTVRYSMTVSAPTAKAGVERDRFDLLFTTDVLAEGMNLQDCRNIVNTWSLFALICLLSLPASTMALFIRFMNSDFT